MIRRASQIILAAAAVLVLLLLGAQATAPLLYTAENTATAAHADPATVQKKSPGNAAALVPLMDDLLGQTGTLALTIKLKDYESAESDLARYADLSGQFNNLVVTLDVSGTDIGEFQQENQQNLKSLATLLNDSRRLDALQKLEIEVRGDDDRHMAVVYEGETLRQKMREGFSAYATREPTTTRIAEHYDLNATSYQQSVEDFAEVADAADEWREKTVGASPRSPLGIAVTPDSGRYGDTLHITGTYAGGLPGTPVEVYIDSRATTTPTLDDNETYACSRQIGRVLSGPHLAYATAGAVYSEVRTFEVLPGNTSLTLALAAVNRTTVTCTGNLTTEGGRAVTGAPVLLRIENTTLVATGTDGNGTYREEISLPAGEHTIQATFHGAGYPLNPAESPATTIHVQGEPPSPLPVIAAAAALLGTGWYLRRRQEPPREAPPKPVPPPAAPEEEEDRPPLDIAGLPPRDAATVLFRALRSNLDLAETKTPRDCARIAPEHARFFERYEKIRYAGVVPTEEELQRMEEEARSDRDGA